MSLSFQKWIRPYNDAVITLTRALLDSAQLLAERLREEAREDQAADQWAAEHPEGLDEEAVPFDEAVRTLGLADRT